MFWSIILFVLGLYILIKGAGSTVCGASTLARFFNVSSWIIGILIVGIGTSIPELSINVSSVIKGGQVGIGTILGSNIFKIL
jgi:cation:H+ antiporter